MIEPDYDKLGPLLTKFGQVITDEVGHLPERAYAFVYGENNWARYVVYVDEGNAVRLYFPYGLFKIITDIWKVENGKRPKALRWIYFEYDIQDGKFNTHFYYPDEIDPDGDPLDWENAGVAKRFGNKRLIQPDFPIEGEPQP